MLWYQTGSLPLAGFQQQNHHYFPCLLMALSLILRLLSMHMVAIRKLFGTSGTVYGEP